MVDISDVTVSEGAEKLKGQPFLLNVFEERARAAIVRKVIQTRVTKRTSIDHKASCIDIA